MSVLGRRLLIGAAGLVAVVLAVPVVVLVDLTVAGTGSAQGCARSSGRDALWLGHAWVDGRRTAAEIRDLAAGLGTTGVRDVFVHVGPLEDDGTLAPERRPLADELLDGLRTGAPDLRVQAWVGNVLGEDGLDLSWTATRAEVTSAAGDLVDDGWDGVHLNVEPIRSGDADYLSLLDELGPVVSGRILSVAAEPIEPRAGLAVATDVVREPLWWTGAYLAEVAARVDQVAVMAYDTGLPTENLYAGMVARQTTQALAAVPDDVDLLIGAPAFHTDDLGHRESAETVRAAAHGVRRAVNRAGECGRGAGLALYVDFDATAGDWQSYCEGWVGRPGAGPNRCG